MPDRQKCCPACGGTNGLSFHMTETHVMVSSWGGSPEAGDSGLKSHNSLATCDDCGTKFNVVSLANKGLLV